MISHSSLPHHIRAKKSLGQNFLVDTQIIERITKSIPLQGKNIIEVGPGYGALTQYIIAQKPATLTLIEIDRDMISLLKKQGFDTDADILEQDVLSYTPAYEDYSLVANIPYYITSPIIMHFLYEVPHTPREMVLLMQEEVAQKILSQKSSYLSLCVAKKSRAENSISVPANAFSPMPNIDSSVLLFKPHSDFADIDDALFQTLVSEGFRAPRKKLLKNFITAGHEPERIESMFRELGIDENIRGEALGIETWIDMVRYLSPTK